MRLLSAQIHMYIYILYIYIVCIHSFVCCAARALFRSLPFFAFHLGRTRIRRIRFALCLTSTREQKKKMNVMSCNMVLYV